MGGLPEHDGYGLAAFSCGADQTWLEPVPDSPGVMRCPRCGHRTDTPGVGVLGDGFDIVHRQWGLRGDVHTWRAMQDLLGTVPTPADPQAVRAAYVDGFRQVVRVDLDASDEAVVHRPELDHGGMSGGSVDLAWWRTKGLPLLAARAIDRRPVLPSVPTPPRVSPSASPPGRVPPPPPEATPPGPPPPIAPPAPSAPPPPPAAPAATRVDPSRPPRTARTLLVDVLVWAVLLAIPAATIGGGLFLLYQRAVGTRVEATVLECSTSGGIVRGASTYRTDCIAEWTIDGRVVIGPFTGGNGESDVGKTVDATVRGDTAYSRSLGLPILLLALGLPFLALLVIVIRGKRRGRSVRSPVASRSR